MLLTAGVVASDPRVFYYGEIIHLDAARHTIRVRGDDRTTRRFRITTSTQIEKNIEKPTAGSFEDMRLGLRVRVLPASDTPGAPRTGLRIFLYLADFR